MKTIKPKYLLEMYSQGFFPMAVESDNNNNQDIKIFSPNPRGIIPLDKFHIPKTLKRFIKKSNFKIKINNNFAEVIKNCSNRDETWIDDTIINSYLTLFELGYAHSVETYEDETLIGGLYGVSLGGAFFGESMFSKVSNASSFALIELVRLLNKQDFDLLDTQWTNPHLIRFGAIDISRDKYLKILKQAIKKDTYFAKCVNTFI